MIEVVKYKDSKVFVFKGFPVFLVLQIKKRLSFSDSLFGVYLFGLFIISTAFGASAIFTNKATFLKYEVCRFAAVAFFIFRFCSVGNIFS